MAAPLRQPSGSVREGFTWSDPDPGLRAYVERARAVLVDGRPLAERVDDVNEAARELARAGFHLPRDCRRVAPDSYGRNLVYRDRDCGFVLIAMVWPAKVDSPVHDHGTWCSLVVLEGQVEVVCYEAAERGGPRLVEIDRRVAGVGEACAILPPGGDIHRVWNPFEETAVTLHTYGRDVGHCNVFDVAKDERHEKPLSYLNLD